MLFKWTRVKDMICFKDLRQEKSWKDVQFWSPGVFHVAVNEVGCKSAAQKALRSTGIIFYNDLVDGEGNKTSWPIWEMLGIANCHSRAYTKLCGNTTITKLALSRRKKSM
jgi:hypothetical protein